MYPTSFKPGYNGTLTERMINFTERRGRGDCWRWRGSICTSGYGQINIGGKMMIASRVAYQMRYGPIPDGLIVMHTCDNRACVNPAHLRLGTKRANTDDMLAKGRGGHPRGEMHPAAKLSLSDIPTIKSLRSAGMSFTDIGARFGVDRTTIARIIKGRSWR